MRSRASGGTCGAGRGRQRRHHVELRRRAIWVQRAMSTERSSIGGGPARARPRRRHRGPPAAAAMRAGHAPQPAGRSGVADHAVGHGALLECDRDRLPLATDLRDDHSDPSRLDLFARDQPLDLGATAAPGGSFSQRQKASCSAGRLALLRRAPRRCFAASGPRHPLRAHHPRGRGGPGGQRCDDSSRTTRVPRVSNASSRARRRPGSATAQRAVTAPQRTAARPAPASPAQSSSCASSIRTSERLTAGRCRRAPGREPHEVALVAGSELSNHAVVRREDRGELAFTRAVLLLCQARTRRHRSAPP